MVETRRRGLVLLLAAALFAGCRQPTPVAEAPPLEVVVAQPVREQIESWDVYTGTVESKEQVQVTSRVRGEIKEVRFKEGQEIPAGTDMFLIDDGPFKADLSVAKGQLATWDAKLKIADERIELYRPLAEKGSVSKEELLKAIADRGEALGGIDAARGRIMVAELNIGYCKITSPIAGKVGEALFTKGNIVSGSGADSQLARVVAVDPMYVYFNVNERALLNYRKHLADQAAKESKSAEDAKTPPKVPVELGLASGNEFPFKGVVDFVDNRVDSTTSSIRVRARFENPKVADGNRALTAGLFARVRIRVAQPYQGVLVADRAVLTDQNLKYVLLVDKKAKNTVRRVDVTAADRLQPNGLREIQAGLTGDEWIIVDGINRARPGVVVEPKDGPMPKRPAKA